MGRWKAYQARCASELAGYEIVGPAVHNGLDWMRDFYSAFFAACPECQEPASPLYVTYIAFHAYATASDTAGPRPAEPCPGPWLPRPMWPARMPTAAAVGALPWCPDKREHALSPAMTLSQNGYGG